MTRIGIVGLGRLGQRHAVNLAWHVPGATLAAACSPVAAEREWAKSHLPELKLYGDYEALLDDETLGRRLARHAHVIARRPDHRGLARGQACVLRKAAVAGSRTMRPRDCRARAFSASAGDDRFRATLRRKLSRRLRQGGAGRDRPAVHGPFANLRQERSRRLLRSFSAPTSGGLFLDCSVHDIDLARWMLGNPAATRVYASGTIALHEGLKECGDIDNGVAVCEFEGGRLAVFYASRTMAHGHDTQTEVIGTAGALSVGHNPRANRVVIADSSGVRNECTPTFFERFEAAFLHEAQAFVASLQKARPRPASRCRMPGKRRGSASRCGRRSTQGNR